MESHKKQDDLADSFLQGIYFLRSLRKRQNINRKIRKHLGVEKEIVIREESDKEHASKPFVYKSEDFVVPEFNIDGKNVTMSTKYSRV